MNQATMKKEFKRKCKQEKAACWRYNVIGTTVALVGLVIAVVAFLLTISDSLVFPISIIISGVGLLIALIGAALDIAGDVLFRRQFKEYLEMQKKQSEE